jgi:hypothetical protein
MPDSPPPALVPSVQWLRGVDFALTERNASIFGNPQ